MVPLFAFPLLRSRRAQVSPDLVGRRTVGFSRDSCIEVEGHPGRGVPEARLRGLYVGACGDEGCGGERTQIVEAQPGESGRLARW